MNPPKIILIFLVIALFYIVFINIFSNLTNHVSGEIIEGKYVNNGGLTQKVGTSYSASASVEKKRWYGTIYEEHSDYTISNLYVLKFIKIPIQNKRFNFKLIHIIVLSLSIIMTFGFILENKQRRSNVYQNSY